MNKYHVIMMAPRRLSLALFLLLAACVTEATAQEIWTMPKELPTTPPGATPATFPLPRFEWLQRIIENNAKANKAPETIQLVFDGDSITDGWQGKGRRTFDERYGKIGVFDFGLSGDRTQNLLWRLYNGQVDKVRPKLVVLLIGTNNIGFGEKPEDAAAGVKAVVEEYRKRLPESVILLQAVFPRGQSPQDQARPKIDTLNREIAKLADGEKVVFLDFGEKFLNPDGSVNADLMPDFLHPNDKGYVVWADAIQPVIDKYFPPR
ncbi:lysophospholiPASe L1 [Terrimicrobium sacchariphilum]|uniref:LysophospholiPASe L1 n=1 Tax=Terrimicrobium sacchariphilum TaxID=690879 RepID=A0A146G4X6_TERSA|nr:GDSL-type esterase/lipase family protein [Terrimicrobium sacchariphilum]GAT32631.1 lysophospholiPASe L1 [Terrimicrobium sacchariphilum]